MAEGRGVMASSSMQHRLGRICHVQAPGGFLQLAKIIDNRAGPCGHIWTLVRWIDIRRDAEWVPTYVIPPEELEAGL